MKKEMTLNYTRIENTDERAIVEEMAAALRIPQEWLRKYYSAIIGRKLTKHQASLITRTQLSFVALIILTGYSALLGIAAVAWFAYSLLQCKHEIK